MAFNFKEMVAADLRRTILNLEEFGRERTVEGKKITVVDDEDTVKELTGGQKLGIAECSLLFFAAVEDLPPRRPAGEGLNVDGREYIILDWSENMGLATVALAQNIVM